MRRLTMEEAGPYLGLKRAARLLGVHEQTLRSWEERGLIRMVRLPGSGYRRVPVEEVERLSAEMAAARPDPGVVIARPDQDSESAAAARMLAETVCAELADLEATTTLDEFMASLRGRAWSP